MKRLLLLALMFLSVVCYSKPGEPLRGAGIGEYIAGFVHSNGDVYYTWRVGNETPKYQQIQGISDAVDAAGGQYTFLAWTRGGTAYEVYKGGSKDTYTIPGGVVYGYMFNQMALLVNPAGDLYYTLSKDVAKYEAMDWPKTSVPLLIKAGLKIKKLTHLTNGYGLGILTQDNKFYTWALGGQPVQVNLPGGQIPRDITSVTRGAWVVSTESDIFTWGPQSVYLGVNANNPTSLLPKLPGIKFPLKQIIGNWQVLQIIDADNNRWAGGDNVMGEIGNGKGKPDWKNATEWGTGKPTPYAWNWLNGQQLEPLQKIDKMKRLYSSGSMAFYWYGEDLTDNLKFWGRDKSYAGNTGRYLNYDPDAAYPNAMCVYTPIIVTPENTRWTMIAFDPYNAPNNYPLASQVVYKNVEQKAVFTKSDCGENAKGSSVQYVVPAGRYTGNTQAEADQLAVNDLQTKGQAYANTNGKCTIIRTVTNTIQVFSDGTIKVQ